MSSAKKKSPNETHRDAMDTMRSPSPHELGSGSLERKKRIRSISPLGMRVVVRIRDIEDTTDGGLYLPESAKSSMSESLLAEVLEVASAIDEHTDEEANISGIPLGATVLIEKDSGVHVPWDESLRLVDSKDILAMVEEVEVN